MKESDKMPTIKFYQQTNSTALGSCPVGNKKKKKQNEKKRYGKNRWETEEDLQWVAVPL